MSEDSSADRVSTATDAQFFALAAYASLAAFTETAAGAAQAPELSIKEAMATLATAHHENYRWLSARSSVAGSTEVSPRSPSAMDTFVPAVDAFHARTRPGDWLEGVMKAYLGAGVVCDLMQPIDDSLAAPGDGAEQRHPLARAGRTIEALADVVRGALVVDPRAAGRLALWGRRLAGEALSQAQRLAADRPGLFLPVLTDPGGPARGRVDPGRDAPEEGRPGQNDLPQGDSTVAGPRPDELLQVGELFVRLTARHAERLRGLGLAG